MSHSDKSSRVRHSARAESRIFDLPMARRTIPLVRRILSEIVAAQARAAHLELQIRRNPLRAGRSWDEARVSFRVADDLAVARRNAEQAGAELSTLGVNLLDPVRGVGGFPTLVNGSLAFLVLGSSDDDIRYWRYRNQPRLRPIPEQWNSEPFFPESGDGSPS